MNILNAQHIPLKKNHDNFFIFKQQQYNLNENNENEIHTKCAIRT